MFHGTRGGTSFNVLRNKQDISAGLSARNELELVLIGYQRNYTEGNGRLSALCLQASASLREMGPIMLKRTVAAGPNMFMGQIL